MTMRDDFIGVEERKRCIKGKTPAGPGTGERAFDFAVSPINQKKAINRPLA